MLSPRAACDSPAAVSGPLAISLCQKVNFCVFSGRTASLSFHKKLNPNATSCGSHSISFPFPMFKILQIGLGGSFSKVSLL